MEEELAAGLGEGQVAEFVEDQEVEAAEEIGQPALAVGPVPGMPGTGPDPRSPRRSYELL